MSPNKQQEVGNIQRRDHGKISLTLLSEILDPEPISRISSRLKKKAPLPEPEISQTPTPSKPHNSKTEKKLVNEKKEPNVKKTPLKK